jgi:hypothetical protein
VEQVQSIKNEFAVEVYETHARLCLENGDIIEFNQCQSNLKVLYNMGVPGNVMEFTAYRILYLLYERNNSSKSLAKIFNLYPTTHLNIQVL